MPVKRESIQREQGNRSLTRYVATIALVLGAGVGFTGLGGCQKDDTTSARESEVLADSVLTHTHREELRLLRFRDSEGTVHEGWLRRVFAFESHGGSDDGNPEAGHLEQTVLVLGGIGTGRRAAEIIPCPPGFAVLAMDYPYEGSRTASPTGILLSVPEIRAAATATPRGVRAGLEYLRSRPDADPRGVVVIGASFGASFILKALADLPREIDLRGHDHGPQGVRAVSILFWGADLDDLVQYRMRDRAWWEREPIKWALNLGFQDLEPARNVPAIAPRPQLFISGEDDELVSPEASRRLFAAAGEPKTQIWLPTRHLQPDAEELLQELVQRTLDWLETMEAGEMPDSVGRNPQ